MHVPDHFLDPQTSIASAAVALTAVVVATWHARRELPDDDRVPMAGLVATFVFAAQMLNFAVGDGTSGHLMGGVLAAVLVGPATAVLCLTAVLVVQAVFFADGGVTALGANVTLMAVVGVLVGWAVFRAATRLAPPRPAAVPLSAALAALVSVPATALVFTGLFAAGGTAAVDLGAVAGAMVGWHALIGVGEAAITLAAVTAVMWARPDLVFGARRYLRARTVSA
ncbi:energy-coupling factor ABC transporter permease [Aeromicrobium senzhongii]|uniref:Energy-coupling factor ABC transporter permease n=1 Tax=Aeromicrobium senzhongii TaxID=2663859 RepID=A0ABX6SQE8_9ACTN|nr:energy-coupling factor ABC transporter permease [Aeromicrobium senzhongii]MTB89127.1 cobalamin biosynthesis protein CbiM [Aeromicrobium senzhongii]QNL93604.1 energy-coupling factor ABC transporter permease [Aeromicrobium senzhongii]